MRSFVFAIAFCSVVFTLNAQESNRGDNTIIIHTEESYADAFRTIGQLFVQNGYTIDNADRDFGTITTREVRVGSRLDPLWEMKITAMVTGTDQATIVLTAMIKGEGQSWEPLDKRGRIHMFTKGWESMEELVRKYPSGFIEFEQRN